MSRCLRFVLLWSLALVSFSTPCSQLYAQWTTSGSDVYNSNPGKVGIGTTAPSLRGEIRSSYGDPSTSGMTPNGIVAITTGDVYRGIYFGISNRTDAYYPGWIQAADWNDLSTTRNLALNPNGGGVGVGTFYPFAKLQVGSAGGAAQSIYDIGASKIGAGTSIYSYGSICTQNYNHDCSGGGGVVLGAVNTAAANNIPNIGNIVFTSGNVGIGTTTPATKLDVAGDVTANHFNGILNATYQDVAEWVPSTGVIPAGYVVVTDRSKANHVLPSSEAYDTRVAGVVSEKPGIVLGEAALAK